LAFAATPFLLQPILRLVREYQLSSLADLLAFRFRGRVTGALVTGLMLIGLIPYLSLQVRAITQSTKLLVADTESDLMAIAFCATLVVFTVLFGARHLTPRERHAGLVAAIAFESAVKLIALLSVGAFAWFGVFGGGQLGDWLAANPEALAALYEPVAGSSWTSLMVLSFCAAFLLPRQFHMMFTENDNPRSLQIASFAFPLYLLLLNLPIIPILWAGQHLVPGAPADMYVLAITRHAQGDWLTVLAFVGGISAASAMIIVTTLALSAMCMTHWFLPAGLRRANLRLDLHRSILWGRRCLIALIMLLTYGFYRVIELNAGLAQMGLISFVAVAQFLPGVLALLFWSRATQEGFLLGLAGGAVVWFSTLILPLVTHIDLLDQPLLVQQLIGGGQTVWSDATFWSLTVNATLLVIGSLLTRPTLPEIEAAEICVSNMDRPLTGTVAALSPDQFERQLSNVMGRKAARREVETAMSELKLSAKTITPTQLRQLRERIERNLSGLLGPVLARLIVDDRLLLKQRTHEALSDSMRFMEGHLEQSRTQLRGAMRQLDDLRRYHRDVLRELPIGVCSLDGQGTIVIWNSAMKRITGIEAVLAEGRIPATLPAPWNTVLTGFVAGTDTQRSERLSGDADAHRSINLHKSSIETSMDAPQARNGLVILVEDRTAVETLEAELAHSERLASIGRFAAGVAHEIGNPLTGIDSIAQNLAYEDSRSAIEQASEDIVIQTRRIGAIVKSLLAFSRGDPLAPLDRQTFGLQGCIEEACALVALDERARTRQVKVNCPPGLELTGEPQKIMQVIVNLLSNACDASDPGDEIRIDVRQHGDTALISVEDHGCGIDPTHTKRLFEPFFTTKHANRGTGLGLPLVHAIVKEHGGKVSVQSTRGAGTTFRITLPMPHSHLTRLHAS
ncbi:MAG: ATP-binding protein, partial [Pseudomonadota bacterium]